MGSEPSLNNVTVEICCELGRKEMTLREARALRQQDVIELNKLAGEPFKIRVNDRPFAEGEIVILTDVVGVRLTRMVEVRQEVGP